MKKVLFATTALVLAASAASAEVAVSGTGRMGVVYNGQHADFSSRARVAFGLSGETDGGLGFGGSVRADQAGAANSGNASGGNMTAGSLFVSGSFGKIEMGDVASAPEALFGDLAGVGYTGLTDMSDIPYLTQDDGGDEAILYTYTAGALSVAASMSDSANVAGGSDYAVAAAYGFGNYVVGLGYEAAETAAGVKSTMTEIAAIATFGDTSVKAFGAQGGDAVDTAAAYGASVSHKMGATTISAFTNHVEGHTSALADKKAWGLGAEYDLGGGASLAGGVAKDDVAGGDAMADLGVKFKF